MVEEVNPAPSDERPTVVRSARAERARRIDAALGWAVVVLSVIALAGSSWFGYTLWNAKQMSDASNPATRVIREVEDAVRQNPNSAELRIRLGEAYAGAGKYDRAVKSFQQALEIEPEHTGAFLDLGKTAMIQNDLATASDAFQKVVDLSAGGEYENLDARREEALFYLGQIAITEHQFEDAVRFFKGALRIRRDASDTYLNLAIAYKNLDEIDAAIDNIAIAIQLDPRLPTAHYALGEIYRDQDKIPAAAVEFRSALDSDPENQVYLDALETYGPIEKRIAAAKDAIAAEEIQPALDESTIAKSLDPTNATAMLLYAQALDASGRPEDALSAYKDAQKLDKANKEIEAAIARLEKSTK